MNVLHLIEPGRAGGGPCTLRLVADAGVPGDVVVCGGRSDADLARRCGVRVSAVVPAPAGSPILARGALWAVIRAGERARSPYDAVHAWTPGAAAAAASLRAVARRVVLNAVAGPAPGARARAHAFVLRRRGVPVRAATAAAAEAWRAALGAAARVSVLAPGVDAALVDERERGAVRRRWNVDDGTFLVGLLCEPACEADARQAVGVMVRVVASGRNAALVLDPRARRLAEVGRWTDGLGLGIPVALSPEVAEPWRIAPALDAALFVTSDGSSRCSVLPLLWAAAARRPLVAEASGASREVVDDGRSGLLFEQGDLNGAARALLRLRDDAGLARRLGAAARAEVEERFDASGFRERLEKDAYG